MTASAAVKKYFLLITIQDSTNKVGYTSMAHAHANTHTRVHTHANDCTSVFTYSNKHINIKGYIIFCCPYVESLKYVHYKHACAILANAMLLQLLQDTVILHNTVKCSQPIFGLGLYKTECLWCHLLASKERCRGGNTSALIHSKSSETCFQDQDILE